MNAMTTAAWKQSLPERLSFVLVAMFSSPLNASIGRYGLGWEWIIGIWNDYCVRRQEVELGPCGVVSANAMQQVVSLTYSHFGYQRRWRSCTAEGVG